MRHHRNRLAAILLAAVLTGGLVTGCGKTAPVASGPAPEVLDAVRVDDCTVELTFSQPVRVEDVRHLYAESGGVLLPETAGETVRVTDCVFDGDTLKGANATTECLRISAAAEGEWRTVETADGPQSVLYDGTACADVTVSGCL